MSTSQIADSSSAVSLKCLTLHRRPPVIVMNMFYSGLGIARALYGKGVRVVGLSAHPKSYGNFTRLCEIRRAPNSQDQPEELAHFLLQQTNDLQGAIVFPTRDVDVRFLDRFRVELETKYSLCLPSSTCLRKTIDKHELARLAQAIGIAVPKTARVDHADDLARVPIEVGFPCVLKPIRAFEWRMEDAWQKVGARKAVRIDTQKQLEAEYISLSLVSHSILVQEWIGGSTDQLVILGGYADANSDLMTYFTARKILQTPDDCGTGCIVQSEPLPELLTPSRKLLHSLRYHGIAEIEYKYDPSAATYKLIEINTRHWDQHELGLASGVNVTWAAYCDLTLQPIPPVPPTVRATWIAEDSLLSRMVRSFSRPELRVNVWGKISSRRIYGIFARRDPMPSLRYFFTIMIPHLAKAILAKAAATIVSRGRKS